MKNASNKNITTHRDLGRIQTYDPVKEKETPIKKEGYKKTKLGWIPEEWETPMIKETFDYINTNSFSRNQLNYEEADGVYNIHYGDIHATFKQPILDFENEKKIPKINKEILLSNNTTFLRSGDLIIADASEDYEGVGVAIELKNVKDRRVVGGLHTFVFRDKRNTTVDGFRAYIFRNHFVKKALMTIATGSKVYGLSKSNILKFRFVLPTLPEQQKIATILSTWDRAIAKQEQLIAEKQDYKKGLMQLLLTGKLRFPGFEGEWKEVRLEDVGLIQTGNTPSKKNTHFWGGNYNWVTAEDMNGKYVLNTSQKLTTTGKSKARIAKKGSILVTCIASIGKNAITKVDTGFNQQINSITTSEDYDNEFTYYLINFFPQKLLIYAGAGAMAMLNKKTFMSIKFKFPILKEQQKIASVLSAADAEIQLLETELAQLRDQKRGLMQRLLTGEIRV